MVWREVGRGGMGRLCSHAESDPVAWLPNPHQRVSQALEGHLEAEHQAAQSYDISANPPDHLQGKW